MMNRFSQPPPSRCPPTQASYTPRHESHQPHPPKFPGNSLGSNLSQSSRPTNNVHLPNPSQHMQFHHSRPPPGPLPPTGLPLYGNSSGPRMTPLPYHYNSNLPSGPQGVSHSSEFTGGPPPPAFSGSYQSTPSRPYQSMPSAPYQPSTTGPHQSSSGSYQSAPSGPYQQSTSGPYQPSSTGGPYQQSPSGPYQPFPSGPYQPSTVGPHQSSSGPYQPPSTGGPEVPVSSFVPNQPFQPYPNVNSSGQFQQFGHSAGPVRPPPFPIAQPFPSQTFTTPPPPIVGSMHYNRQPNAQSTVFNKTGSMSSQHVTLQEKGKLLLDAWLQKSKGMRKAEKFNSRTSAQDKSSKVWHEQIHQLSWLLTKMTHQADNMEKGLTDADNETWSKSLETFNSLKQQFNDLNANVKVTKPDQTQRHFEKALKKRARLKRARQEKYEQSLRMKEQWDLKGKMIDAWQTKCANILREENKKKARKAAADKTLSVVNKDISDANKLIETMTALQKLRLIRRDAAEKRGDSNLGESREAFEGKVADMIRLVRGQLEFYMEEETRLKSIIKSEVEESNKKEKEDKEDHDQACMEKEDLELRTLLFGAGVDEVASSDPLFPYAQYYRQAGHDMQTFLNIRHQWDAFIVPETTREASCIPSSWVIPQEPNSAVWASTLL